MALAPEAIQQIGALFQSTIDDKMEKYMAEIKKQSKSDRAEFEKTLQERFGRIDNQLITMNTEIKNLKGRVAAVEVKPVRTASSPPDLRNPNSTIVITGFVPPKSDEGLWQDEVNAIVDPLIKRSATTNGMHDSEILGRRRKGAMAKAAKIKFKNNEDASHFLEKFRTDDPEIQFQGEVLELRAKFDQTPDEKRKGYLIFLLRKGLEEKWPALKIGQNKHFGEVLASVEGKRPSPIFKVSEDGYDIESKVAALTRLGLNIEEAEAIRTDALDAAGSL